jgi:hypothetical protein
VVLRKHQISLIAFTVLLANPQALARIPGSIEAAFFGGAVFKEGAHRTVGATVGVQVIPHVSALADISWSSLGDTAFGEVDPFQTTRITGGSAFEVGGTAHIWLTERNSKLMPYVAVGFGALHSKATLVKTRMFGLEYTKPSDRWLPLFTAGLGFRCFLANPVGVRPEVRLGIGEETIFRVSIALFVTGSP